MLFQSYPTIVTGSSSQANTRISAIDGTAFIELLEVDLLRYTGRGALLQLFDSTGKELNGYLKAPGTEETLDSDIITGGAFTDWTGVDPDALPDGWTGEGTRNASNYTTESVDKCRMVSDGTLIGIKQSVTAVSSQLLKQTIAIDTVTSGGIYTRLTDQYGGSNTSQQDYTTTGNKEAYYTANALGVSPLFIDTMVIKPVLTPSTDGATIVNSKGGTTYNFLSKNASFVYNQSSYFCIVRLLR